MSEPEPRAGWLAQIFIANAVLCGLGVAAMAFVAEAGAFGQVFVLWCMLTLSSTWTLGTYDKEVQRD